MKWYPFFVSALRIGGASIIAHTAHQINEEIHDKEVRLISAQGGAAWDYALAEAMAKAGEADLDLVKISPTPSPVCKLMDYGKYRFEQTKRDKEKKTSGSSRSKKCVCPRESTSMISMSRSATPSAFIVRRQPGEGHRPLPRP